MNVQLHPSNCRVRIQLSVVLWLGTQFQRFAKSKRFSWYLVSKDKLVVKGEKRKKRKLVKNKKISAKLE